jgi:hypothetical protein
MLPSLAFFKGTGEELMIPQINCFNWPKSDWNLTSAAKNMTMIDNEQY